MTTNERAILPTPRSRAQIIHDLRNAQDEQMELLAAVGRWAAIQMPPILIVDGIVHRQWPPVPSALTDAVGMVNERITCLERELAETRR